MNSNFKPQINSPFCSFPPSCQRSPDAAHCLIRFSSGLQTLRVISATRQFGILLLLSVGFSAHKCVSYYVIIFFRTHIPPSNHVSEDTHGAMCGHHGKASCADRVLTFMLVRHARINRGSAAISETVVPIPYPALRSDRKNARSVTSSPTSNRGYRSQILYLLRIKNIYINSTPRQFPLSSSP